MTSYRYMAGYFSCRATGELITAAYDLITACNLRLGRELRSDRDVRPDYRPG
jgi:hypothetical protein